MISLVVTGKKASAAAVPTNASSKSSSSHPAGGAKKTSTASPKKKVGSGSNGSTPSTGGKKSGTSNTPLKVVVKDAESALRSASLHSGGSGASNASTAGLGHEMLAPGLPPGTAFSSPLRDSSSSGCLGVSSEINRSGSKSKMVKQMPDSKREKALRELAAEAASLGSPSSSPSPSPPVHKSHLNMVVIGHVDSGKSTTMGHLLYLLGLVEKKTIDKFETESRNIGKASFHFAWVMDEQAEERARGVTIDVAVYPFETDRHKITILDAPGHQDFVPNMISGASQADVAVLVVNSSDAEYATILDLGQAKEHIILARSLGVGQLIVAVNKLDTCGWSKERFEFVRELLLPFLRKSGFKDSAIQFIPTSGLSGENLTKRSERQLSEWYNGYTLIEAINNFQPAKRDIEKPFRMSIHDVFRDAHALGLTVAGKIESGFLTTGDKLLHLPLGNIVTVKGLRVGQHQTDRASAGINVEVGVTDVEEKMLSIGDVLCDPMHGVPMIQKFQAQLVTFDLEKPLLKGQNVIYYAANLNEPATITKLIGICDQSGGIKQKNPRALTARVTALVEVALKRKIPAELYKEYRGFGRFTIREGGKTLAAGIITELEPSASTPSSSYPSSPAPPTSTFTPTVAASSSSTAS